MEGTLKICVLVLLAILQIHSVSSQDLNTIFNCVNTLDEGYAVAKRDKKPIMLVVHKNSCGACKRLKPKLQDSKAVKAYSENFVVVNAVDGLDPKAEAMGPKYYPRFLFFGPDGKPLQVTNPNNREYKYYYEFAEDVYNAMQSAVKLSAKKKY